MPFWTTQRIQRELRGDQPVVLSAKSERVNNGCYEMAVAGEAFISSMGDAKRTFSTGEQFAIPPGQFALLITEEELQIPLDVLCFISMPKSSRAS